MYIPTQEERYAKKGVVSLILCVVVPSCLYVSLLSKQLMMVRGHEWEAVMKLFLAFTYLLAALRHDGHSVLLVVCGTGGHAGIVAWLKTNALLSLKAVASLCAWGCYLVRETIFFGTNHGISLFKRSGYSILYRQTNQDVFNALQSGKCLGTRHPPMNGKCRQKDTQQTANFPMGSPGP
ncbi:MAG: hypothetical protein ACLT8C_04515 [Akkermansia muciniphila]